MIIRGPEAISVGEHRNPGESPLLGHPRSPIKVPLNQCLRTPRQKPYEPFLRMGRVSCLWSEKEHRLESANRIDRPGFRMVMDLLCHAIDEVVAPLLWGMLVYQQGTPHPKPMHKFVPIRYLDDKPPS